MRVLKSIKTSPEPPKADRHERSEPADIPIHKLRHTFQCSGRHCSSDDVISKQAEVWRVRGFNNRTKHLFIKTIQALKIITQHSDPE